MEDWVRQLYQDISNCEREKEARVRELVEQRIIEMEAERIALRTFSIEFVGGTLIMWIPILNL